jgi:hypothetical protein
MSEEKEIINEHYEVVSSMNIGGKRMILAVSNDKEEQYPYLKCIYTENELFGTYESVIASDSYPEAIKLYADDIKAEAVQLELNQRAMGDAALPCYKPDEVRPVYFTDNIIGKVVAVEEKYLSNGYKDRGHQLYYVVGGSGAYPNSRGQACFSYDLYNGKKERIERYEVMGYMREDELPEFAKKTLETVKERVRKEKDKDAR